MKSSKTLTISICDMSIVFIIALYGVLSIPYRMKKFIKLLDIWSNVSMVVLKLPIRV